MTNATYADGYQLNYLYNGTGLLEAVSDSSGLTLVLNYLQIGQQFKMTNAYLSSPSMSAQLVVSKKRMGSDLNI